MAQPSRIDWWLDGFQFCLMLHIVAVCYTLHLYDVVYALAFAMLLTTAVILRKDSERDST